MSQKPRIDWIDSIRGLAAILVMIIHFFSQALIVLLPTLLNQPGYIPNPAEHDTLRDTLLFLQAHHVSTAPFAAMVNYILGYWDLGKIGVAMFFFVSGFVIPYSLFKSSAPIKHFFISRFFRLYPIYWVSVALIVLLGVSTIPLSPKVILANLTMFQKFIGIRDINGVAWTLQIELTFYISCVVLFALGWLKGRRANYVTIGMLWAMSLGLAFVRMKYGIKAPIAMPLGLSLMFMGYIWRKWMLKEEAIPPIQVIALGVLYAVFIPVVSLMGYGEFGATYISTYFIALVLFILFTTVARMRQPFLLFLGKISYSVYLLHPIVSRYAIAWVISWNPQAYIHHAAWLVVPTLTSIIITLAISTLTYHCIEAPFVRIGRMVADKLLQPRKVPMTPELG